MKKIKLYQSHEIYLQHISVMELVQCNIVHEDWLDVPKI